MSNSINPEHYKRLPVEAIEIIEAAIDSAPSNRDAYLHGQVLKYILRCWNKNGIEDLKKAKWYLDRLIDLIDESEQQKAAELQSLKDHPFGKLKTAPLNSDKIPEGYRKMKDSSVEPRQLGDLRWSVSEKRYVEISIDEIEYANRDNWAACRKVEPVVKQSLTPKPSDGLRFRDWPSDSQEFSTPEPPDGWRWLEVGEVIRKGDLPCKDGLIYATEPIMLGMALQEHWKPMIRRNRFEVGEKVVHVPSKVILQVVDVADRVRVVDVCGSVSYYLPEVLAPYIEETK